MNINTLHPQLHNNNNNNSHVDDSIIFMGDGIQTLQISVRDLFVANRQKLIRQIVHHHQQQQQQQQQHRPFDHHRTTNIVILLVGGLSQLRYDTDHEPIFRQESYFFYLTGVKEPDCAVSIHIQYRKENHAADTTTLCSPSSSSEVPFTSRTTLYVPHLSPDYATVMGPIRTLEEWKALYLVDAVHFVDSMEACTLSDLTCDNVLDQEQQGLSNIVDVNNVNSILLLMKGQNSDSGNMYEPPILTDPRFANDELIHIDTSTLFPILAQCRVDKSTAEMYLLRFVTEITSFAHTYVMRNFKCGMYEYQAESLFRHYCYYNYGARLTGYTPICGCGPSSAILHYGHAGEPNMKQSTLQNTLCLFDMGVEYFNYGSDVTCTFPASGTFTPPQKVIYQAVYNAQVAVYQMMRPGVSWVDCHTTAESVILTALVEAGIIRLSPSSAVTDNEGDMDHASKTIAELVEMRMGAVFQPHGLGHFIGLDTHDVGGYLPGHPSRSSLPGLKKLRTSRVLQANMVLTVEPGCYFIDHLLDEAMADHSPLRPYMNVDKINTEYRGFGGVRLEDVVQVTDTGIINYTLCPRTIHEVEAVMAGAKWPPMKDEAPELRRLRLTDTTTLLPLLPAPPSL